MNLIISDVEGILTNGKFHLDSNGIESREFSVVDGSYITLMQQKGFEFVFISGSDDDSIFRRLQKFVPEDRIFLDISDKAACLEYVILGDMYNTNEIETILGVFDGLNDVGIATLLNSQYNGVIFAPQDSVPQILDIAQVLNVKRGEHIMQDLWENHLRYFFR